MIISPRYEFITSYYFFLINDPAFENFVTIVVLTINKFGGELNVVFQKKSDCLFPLAYS